VDRERRIQDLGTLPGDADSSGLGINDRGEVVGVSFDANGMPLAFLRYKGEMVDLNTLVPPDSPLYLLFAHGISSSGEITGFGVNNRWGSDVDRDESREASRMMFLDFEQKRLHFGRLGVRLMGPK
jgi:probable HAF family extracellular repeat protein